MLLARYVQQHDETAFTALVARHGSLVLRLCRRILGDAHHAEDAFQATFLILARKTPSLKHPEPSPSWLHGVARRVALKAQTRAVYRSEDITRRGDAGCLPRSADAVDPRSSGHSR